MDQCNSERAEVSDSKSEMYRKKADFNSYPWFTVLIADGVKDKEGQILFLNNGTTIIINGNVNAITDHREENVFGSLEVIQYRNELKARFIKCDKTIEALLLDLTPAFTGKLHKKNGAFIEVAELTGISFGFGENHDPRIKSMRLQWEWAGNQFSIRTPEHDLVEKR